MSDKDEEKKQKKKKERDANNKAIDASKSKVKKYEKQQKALKADIQNLEDQLENVKKLQKELKEIHDNVKDDSSWYADSADIVEGISQDKFKGNYISDCQEGFKININNPIGNFLVSLRGIYGKTQVITEIEDKISDKQEASSKLSGLIDNENISIKFLELMNKLE